MWYPAAKCEDIQTGGMLAVAVDGCSICLCEHEGEYFGVARGCGHQNVPLDRGALLGWVLTCPLHHVRFDIRSGRHLSEPADAYLGAEPLPEPAARHVQLEQRLMRETPTRDLITFAARVVDGTIEVEVPDDGAAYPKS